MTFFFPDRRELKNAVNDQPVYVSSAFLIRTAFSPLVGAIVSTEVEGSWGQEVTLCPYIWPLLPIVYMVIMDSMTQHST